MGSEADRFNLPESVGSCDSGTGGQPRISFEKKPIRKRGYHRALKRGEAWAVNEAAFQKLANDALKELYGDIAQDLLAPNPLLGLLNWIPTKDAPAYFGLDRTVRNKFVPAGVLKRVFLRFLSLIGYKND